MNTALLFIRSLIFYFFFLVVVLFFTGIVFLLGFILSKKVRQLLIGAPGPCISVLLRVVCGVKVDICGKENLPQGNYVALSNHQSGWETIYLQYLLQPVSTILKKELLYIPIFGWGLSLTNPIAIDRRDPRKAIRQVLEQGLQRLKLGNNVVVYPEGTRIEYGQRGHYARSGAALAIQAEVPILPISHNAGACWPGRKFIKHPGTIKLVIGKPIDTKNGNSKSLTDQVEKWIEAQQLRFEEENPRPV